MFYYETLIDILVGFVSEVSCLHVLRHYGVRCFHDFVSCLHVLPHYGVRFLRAGMAIVELNLQTSTAEGRFVYVFLLFVVDG